MRDAYQDPDRQSDGPVSDDRYALGVVMLQLLTGLEPFGIRDYVAGKLAPNCSNVGVVFDAMCS